MPFAICPFSVVPVRSSSQEKSEQTTQLLFGDLVEVLEMRGKSWLRVRCEWDNCVGWVQSNQLRPITPAEFESYRSDYACALDLLQPVLSNESGQPVSIGARLPHFDGIRLQLEGRVYTYSGQVIFPGKTAPGVELLVKIAKRLLFAPAQAGGRSPLGIDAGGLTQLVYQLLGIRLQREPAQQVFQGKEVDFVDEVQPGDLAFFENRAGKITHVGLTFPDQQILHAWGAVRLDQLDHFGIFNKETKRYTHRLRVIRRLLPAASSAQPAKKPQEASKSNQFELFT
jgi:hypothetical protein